MEYLKLVKFTDEEYSIYVDEGHVSLVNYSLVEDGYKYQFSHSGWLVEAVSEHERVRYSKEKDEIFLSGMDLEEAEAIIARAEELQKAFILLRKDVHEC